MRESFFTSHRRDLLAKTLMDLSKIVVAAAFASKFFFEFPRQGRLAMIGAIIALGLLGFFVCPRKPAGKE